MHVGSARDEDTVPPCLKLIFIDCFTCVTNPILLTASAFQPVLLTRLLLFQRMTSDSNVLSVTDALVAKYQEATNEDVDFSKLYLVKKGATAASTFEISKESLNGSLTCKCPNCTPI